MQLFECSKPRLVPSLPSWCAGPEHPLLRLHPMNQFLPDLSSLRNHSQLQRRSGPRFPSFCVLLEMDKLCYREHMGSHHLPSSLRLLHITREQSRTLSGPAARDSIYRLEKQERVFDIFFSCAQEKCITCPINLVIY